MKPTHRPTCRRAGIVLAAALALSPPARAADYAFGPSQNFTITASDAARDMDSNGTFDHNTGDMSIYWRGSSSDASYMHFDLSSLQGNTITGSVNLNYTVNAGFGGSLAGAQISTANGAWTGTPGSAAPGYAAISGATNPTGTLNTGDIATWSIPAATLQGLVGSPSYQGLVISGGSGATAHFSGTPTLTGSAIFGDIRVAGGSDWSNAVWDDGSKTLTISGNVSGGNVTMNAGTTLSVTGAGTLGSGNFTGAFQNNGTLVFGSSANQTLGGTISGSGSLTKSGTGTLTLAATNSYAGANTVNGGTLAASSASAIGGTALRIATGARVALNFSGQARVPQLLLNGVAQADGTYGSTSSTATNKNNTWFSGTGVILVSSQTPDQAYAAAMQAWNASNWAGVRSAIDWVVADVRLPAKMRSISHLLLARSYQAQGNLSAAAAAFAAVAADTSLPKIHQMEGAECAAEMNRLILGQPARDPEENRVRLPAAPTPGRVLYVSPTGNDSNPGTLAQPFATLNAALAANRLAGPVAGGTAIELADGLYPVTSTISLTSADSGTAGSPLTIRAANPGKAIFYGGKRLSGFQTVTDTGILARLPAEAQGQVMQCSLGALGVSDFGTISGFGGGFQPTMVNLYVNGTPQELSRWPNSGYVPIASLVNPGSGNWYTPGSTPQTFSYTGDRPSRWTTAPDAWLHGYFQSGAYDESVTIGSINTAAKTITTGWCVSYVTGWNEMDAGASWRAFNLLEEIDQPGEWYLNRTNGMLYWYPSADPATATIDFSMLSTTMLSATGVNHVRIEGLVLDCSRGGGLQLTNSSDCIVAGTTVRNMGGVGVNIDGGQRNLMIGCDVHNLDQAACYFVGGDRETLEPGNHVMANCRFRNWGRISRSNSQGVFLIGVGNKITHCEFEDCPNTAISFKGCNFLVEYNSFRNCTNETDDSGVIASWGNPTYRGNIWRFNRFSHCGGGYTQGWVQRRYFGTNIFRFDDVISGQTVYGNIMDHTDQYGTAAGALENNSGRDNFYDNNVIIDAMAPNAGYYGAGNDLYYWRNWTNDPPSAITPTYLAAFPELANLYDGQGQNYLWRSISSRVVQSGLPANDPNAWGGWNYMGNHNLGSDPGFLSGAELKSSIDPALFLSYGMRAIPVEEIGLYDDATRSGWIANPVNSHWNGGSGTWNTASVNWSTAAGSGASQAWKNNGQTMAVFSGTGGTVTTGAAVRADGLEFTAAGYTLAGTSPVILDGPASPIDAKSFGATISAPLAGQGGIAVASTGTVTLSGASTYRGTTAVRLGTLALSGGDNRLPVGTVLTLGDAGPVNTGRLQLNGCNQELAGLWAIGFYNYTYGLYAEDRVVNGSSTPCTLTLNIPGGNNQFFGTLGGPGAYENNFAVVKKGPGKLKLHRGAGWTGGTTITEGTLELNSEFYQGNQYTGTFNIANGATLAVSGVVDSMGFNGATVNFLNGGGGTFTNLGGADWLNWYVANGLTLRTNGGARNTFSAAPNFGLNMNGSSVLFDIARGSDATSDLMVSIPLQAGGSITKQGNGILTLSAANSYNGPTTINSGTLTLQDTYASPAFPIASGAVLDLNVASGSRDYATATFSGGGTLRKTGGGQAYWGAGTATFTLGAGSLIDVQEGTFAVGSWANDNMSGSLADLNVAAGATFDSAACDAYVNALNGAGTVVLAYTNGHPRTMTLGVNNGGGTFSGTIIDGYYGGNGNLVKNGTGTQVLSGINTYTGTTTVNAGKLVVTGSVATTASASVVAGATLEVAGGTLAPTGDLTNNGTLIFTGASQFSAGGTITNNGTIINSSPSMVLPGNIVNNGTVYNIPSVPTGLGATPGTGQITLSWSAVSGATGYKVKQSTVSGGPYTEVATPTGTTQVVSGLTNGTTYYFVVSATNPAGESANSSEVSGVLNGLPLPLLTADIGTVGLAGSASHVGGTYTIQGAGAGVSAAADAFRFVYQNSSGNCSVTARVESLGNTGTGARTGVMIRESLAGNARCAGVYLTPSNGAQFIWRTSTGAMASITSSSGKTAPYWVRLTRTNNVFRAYFSSNGTTWTQFGGNKTISMAANAYIGTAVTSGTTSQLSTGVLTNTVPSP